MREIQSSCYLEYSIGARSGNVSCNFRRLLCAR